MKDYKALYLPTPAKFSKTDIGKALAEAASLFLIVAIILSLSVVFAAMIDVIPEVAR